MALTRPRMEDNFLENYEDFATYARQLSYAGEINPYDGVFYHGISLSVPDSIKEEVTRKVSKIARHPLTCGSIFLRLTTTTMPAPHQAHNDTSMGDYATVVYIGEGNGGTSLVRHRETGMDAAPTSDEGMRVWRRDTNKPDQWEITKLIRQRSNRAAILPAALMHRAEPVGGYGETSEDGRLVLVAFLTKKGE